MTDPSKLLEKAKTSGFWLWVLNLALNRIIPFNQPHGFKILEVGDHFIRTFLPYKRKNKNHIGGLHACALATLSEFTTGALLLTELNPQKYRLILKTIEVNYHYQGKMDAFAKYTISPEKLKQKVFIPLETNESVILPCEISIFDKKGNELTTAKVFWQIKEWGKVKTK